MNHDKGFRLWAALFVAAVILSIFGLWYGVTSAQGTAPTHFSAGCVEQLSGKFWIQFGYYAEKVEVFEVGFVYPEGSKAKINVPKFIRTQIGFHNDFYLEAGNAEIGNAFMVTFQGKDNYDKVGLLASDLGACEDGLTEMVEVTSIPTVVSPENIPTSVPTITETKVTDDCPAWSHESATGNMICLWDLPRASVQ